MKLSRTILLPTGMAMTLSCWPVLAADPMTLHVTIRDHRFEPAELHAPAGVPLVIMVHNADPTSEEFDSLALQVEKIIPGGGELPVRLQPLTPGRYDFIGEFHSDTASGTLVIGEDGDRARLSK